GSWTDRDRPPAAARRDQREARQHVDRRIPHAHDDVGAARPVRRTRRVRTGWRVPPVQRSFLRHRRQYPGRRRLDQRAHLVSLARKLLLAASTNAFLRERATKTAFVRRSVSAFMPGERLEDALTAAAAQQERGVVTILTKLGENVTRAEEAEEVTRHYLEVL